MVKSVALEEAAETVDEFRVARRMQRSFPLLARLGRSVRVGDDWQAFATDWLEGLPERDQAAIWLEVEDLYSLGLDPTGLQTFVTKRLELHMEPEMSPDRMLRLLSVIQDLTADARS